jgi:S1-C subfamily serine protease
MQIHVKGFLSIALLLILLIAVAEPVMAGSAEAWEAYRRGDYASAMRGLRPLAQQGDADAQGALGFMYLHGYGVEQDYGEAANWCRRAAEQGASYGQNCLGLMYVRGEGVPQDYEEAAKWFRRGAEQGYSEAQRNLGVSYERGNGVPQDFVQAHLWYNLAAAQGLEVASEFRETVASKMTKSQLAQAQKLARTWRPRGAAADTSEPSVAPELHSTGSGFFVSPKGDVLTNAHVVSGCRQLRVAGATAKLTAIASGNDLALIATGTKPTEIAMFKEGRGARLGDEVVVAGYPLRGILSSGLNVTTGTVSALSGLGNDTNTMQITAPVQPGNSGGPLLNASGHVIGVVVAKLDAIKLAKVTGDIPQNVNFAIHGGVARAFLDARGVAYQTARSIQRIATNRISDRAKRFTVVVECWK